MMYMSGVFKPSGEGNWQLPYISDVLTAPANSLEAWTGPTKGKKGLSL
jgi:hypothetical protein